jgi:fructose-1-phosphate kinase PfkB-like protein
MAPTSLLALGPNPALQRVMSFESFTLGEVNRAASLSTYVGGKGQGVALALQRWAPSERTMVAHFLGGDTGSFVEAEMQARNIEQITQRVAAPTRICTTLLHGADVTELIDPSGAITEDECAALLSQIDAALPECKGVAFCGTSPPGAGDLYLQIAQRLAGREDELSLTLMLDGYKGIEPRIYSGVRTNRLRDAPADPTLVLAVDSAGDRARRRAQAECV